MVTDGKADMEQLQVQASAGLAHSVPSAVVAGLRRQLGDPHWLLTNTEFAGSAAPLPDRISLGDYLAIIVNLVAAGHREDFVAAALAATRQVHLTAVALAIQSAPSLRHVLMLLARYGGERAGAHRWTVRRSHGRTFVELKSRVPLGEAQPVLAEIVIAAAYYHFLQAADGDIDGLAILLCHDTTAYSASIDARLGGAVRFGARRDGIEMPTSAEAKRNPGHDPVLWALGQARCARESEQLHASQHFSALRAHLAEHLATRSTMPRIAQIAAAERVSPRTLIRHLRGKGLTFQALVDSVRRERAQELIAVGTSVADVAEALGFADPSSFRRSFRRWYGRNPSSAAERISEQMPSSSGLENTTRQKLGVCP